MGRKQCPKIQANTETFLSCKPPSGLETAWTQPSMPEAPKPEGNLKLSSRSDIKPEGLQRTTQSSCGVTGGARLRSSRDSFSVEFR